MTMATVPIFDEDLTKDVVLTDLNVFQTFDAELQKPKQNYHKHWVMYLKHKRPQHSDPFVTSKRLDMNLSDDGDGSCSGIDSYWQPVVAWSAVGVAVVDGTFVAAVVAGHSLLAPWD